MQFILKIVKLFFLWNTTSSIILFWNITKNQKANFGFKSKTVSWK